MESNSTFSNIPKVKTLNMSPLTKSRNITDSPIPILANRKVYKVNTLALGEIFHQKAKANLNIKINSGLISSIYSHCLSSFSDYSGFLLGKTKFISEKNELYYLIDDTIWAFDTTYLEQDDKLKKLIDKIHLKYKDKEILGIFSCYSYSYPRVSLKMQKRYFKIKNIFLEEKVELPFIFGTFCHFTDESSEDKSKNFLTAFWNYSYDDNRFHNVKFTIINLGICKYPNKINHNTNKSLYGLVNVKTFEDQIQNLVHIVKDIVSEIEDNKKDEFKELKESLNVEIKEFLTIISEHTK